MVKAMTWNSGESNHNSTKDLYVDYCGHQFSFCKMGMKILPYAQESSDQKCIHTCDVFSNDNCESNISS